MTIQDRTILALQYLYLNSKETQDMEYVKSFRCQDPLAHAKEFATIKMQTSRRAGHTQAIAELFNHLSDQWIVLSPNLKMSKLINNRCKKCIKPTTKKATILELTYPNLHIFFKSIQQLKNGGLRGYEINGVIIDGTFGLKNKDIKMIYRELLPSMIFETKYFIFVQ